MIVLVPRVCRDCDRPPLRRRSRCPACTEARRTLLARDILPELGATYGGELVKSKAQGALC